MLSPEKLARISALTKKANSSVGLTEEETAERAALRALYLESVRAQVISSLENVRIVEADGTITPLKKRNNARLS